MIYKNWGVKMDDKQPIEEIQKEIDAIKKSQEEAKAESQAKMQETYAKAKAESETKEMAIIAQDTNKTLQTKLNTRLANHIDTDELVSAKIEETATKLVEQGLKVQEKKVESDLKTAQKEERKAEFELSEDQYRAFGQDTAPKKPWQQKLIELGYDIWFVFWYFVCFWTLAPFYMILKIIKNQKGVLKFVAISAGVVLLLAILAAVTYLILKITGAVH